MVTCTVDTTMTRIQIGQTRLLAHVLLAAATIGTTCFAKDGGGPTASQRADAGTDLHRMFFDPVRPTPGERAIDAGAVKCSGAA